MMRKSGYTNDNSTVHNNDEVSERAVAVHYNQSYEQP